MKIFNEDLKETIFSDDFIRWWKEYRALIAILAPLITIGVGGFVVAPTAIILNEYKNNDNDNEDFIAEETNAQDKIYNIELADGTMVSFTQEEYENFKEYLNSIKPEEEKTYKLTR